jgi:hypothetical protein
MQTLLVDPELEAVRVVSCGIGGPLGLQEPESQGRAPLSRAGPGSGVTVGDLDSAGPARGHSAERGAGGRRHRLSPAPPRAGRSRQARPDRPAEKEAGPRARLESPGVYDQRHRCP